MYEFEGTKTAVEPMPVKSATTARPQDAASKMIHMQSVTCRICAKLWCLLDGRVPRYKWTPDITVCPQGLLTSLPGQELGLDDPHYCIEHAGLYSSEEDNYGRA